MNGEEIANRVTGQVGGKRISGEPKKSVVKDCGYGLEFREVSRVEEGELENIDGGGSKNPQAF